MRKLTLPPAKVMSCMRLCDPMTWKRGTDCTESERSAVELCRFLTSAMRLGAEKMDSRAANPSEGPLGPAWEGPVPSSKWRVQSRRRCSIDWT